MFAGPLRRNQGFTVPILILLYRSAYRVVNRRQSHVGDMCNASEHLAQRIETTACVEREDESMFDGELAGKPSRGDRKLLRETNGCTA